MSTARKNWIWPTFRDRVGPVACRCRLLDHAGVIMFGRVVVMMALIKRGAEELAWAAARPVEGKAGLRVAAAYRLWQRRVVRVRPDALCELEGDTLRQMTRGERQVRPDPLTEASAKDETGLSALSGSGAGSRYAARWRVR